MYAHFSVLPYVHIFFKNMSLLTEQIVAFLCKSEDQAVVLERPG